MTQNTLLVTLCLSSDNNEHGVAQFINNNKAGQFVLSMHLTKQ